MEYLVESALLTHGLKSVSNETIKKEWQDPGKKITWIDHGEIRIGDIDEFLEFRSRAAAYPRIDCDLLEKALVEKQSGALTASGTMESGTSKEKNSARIFRLFSRFRWS